MSTRIPKHQGGADKPTSRESSTVEVTDSIILSEEPCEGETPGSRRSKSSVSTTRRRRVRGQDTAAPAATATATATARAPVRLSDALRNREGRPWLISEGEIAKGGMGSVLKVLDRKLHRRVAVKALLRDGDDVQSRVRFVEEAMITAQLDHPNIPPIYDIWLNPSGHVCYTMKLVRGRTLHDMIAQRAPAGRTDAELEELLQILLKVCDAVSFAHSHGVIHRDLKPDNIMVGLHGQIYVMDWGCALIRSRGVKPADLVTVGRDPESQPLDNPGLVVGTCAYMAPEQALGYTARIDERTDVYLLGAVLFAILTGRAPHGSKTVVESADLARRNVIPDPERLTAPAKLPPALCAIARRAMATEPSERFSNVATFRTHVELSLKRGLWFDSLTFPAGALVVREGDHADAAFLITDGTCEAFHVENGKRVSLRRMGPGEAFGETSIFTGRPRTASVEALTPLTVTTITREALERAISGKWWMGGIVRAMAERFRDLDERLAQARQGER